MNDQTTLQRRAKTLLRASRQLQRKLPRTPPAVLAAHRALVKAQLDETFGRPGDLVAQLRHEADLQARQGEYRLAARVRRRAALMALDGIPRPITGSELLTAIESLEAALAEALGDVEAAE